MNKQDLIELVKKIQSGNGTEDEQDELIELFSANVPDPNAIDYIFDIEYDHLSPEEIVEKSLNYKSFKM